MSSDKQMLWLGTLPGRSLIAGRRVRCNDVFATPFVESEFRANAEAFGVDQHTSNVLWGVAEVKLERRHSPIDVLTKYESAQLRGWCSAFDTMDLRSLAQELVFFQVLNIWLLDRPVAIPTFSQDRSLGSLVHREGDSHSRLFNRLVQKPLCAPPRLALRLPAPWAPMVISSRWHTLCLPDANGNQSRALSFQWHLTDFIKPAPRKMLYEEEPLLSQEMGGLRQRSAKAPCRSGFSWWCGWCG